MKKSLFVNKPSNITFLHHFGAKGAQQFLGFFLAIALAQPSFAHKGSHIPETRGVYKIGVIYGKQQNLSNTLNAERACILRGLRLHTASAIRIRASNLCSLKTTRVPLVVLRLH